MTRTRPRQNRVTPFGTIEATHHKGRLLANRGDLHDEQGRLGGELWQRKAWITCRLKLGTKRIAFDTPGRYYPLFFMDEAVAFAAGHRPCGKCRPEQYVHFRECWNILNGHPISRRVFSSEMDEDLHADRAPYRRWFVTDALELPNGAFVSPDNQLEQAFMIWDGQLWRWSWDGYALAAPFDQGMRYRVLTPPRMIEILALGFTLTCLPKLDPVHHSDNTMHGNVVK